MEAIMTVLLTGILIVMFIKLIISLIPVGICGIISMVIGMALHPDLGGIGFIVGCIIGIIIIGGGD